MNMIRPHAASPRRPSAMLRGALAMLATCGLALPAAEKPAPPPMKDANGVLAVTVPARLIPEPEERGKPYKVPATEWKLDPILWGWTCELPDGGGMTFGGVQQIADDGLAHTQLKTADGWRPIHEELRKSNPLQRWFAQTRSIREASKDALAKARSLYFEGKTTAEETRLVKAEVDPAIDAVAKNLATLMTGLKGLTGLQPYEAGQTAFALKHLEAAAGHLKPFNGVTTPEQMADLRRGQIELEIAGEAFDAEPPPRALSKIAYEPKSKSFVIFGGWHMDYALRSTRRLLSRPDRPTAILALWQYLGLAVAQVAKELGLVLGRDLDLVGWSVSQGPGAETLMRLSGMGDAAAVTWDPAAMAELCVLRLLQRREHPHLPVSLTRVPVRLWAPSEQGPGGSGAAAGAERTGPGSGSAT